MAPRSENGLPSADERLKLIAALREAIHDEGQERFLRGRIVEPTASFFLERWTPDVHGVELIAKRLLDSVGLGHLSVVVSDDAEELGETAEEGPITHHPEGCVWLSTIADNIVVFGASCSRLDDVAGFLAHEIGHLAALLRSESSAVASSPYRATWSAVARTAEDEEHRALAYATTLGLGILTLNNASKSPKAPSLLGSVGELSATLFQNDVQPEHAALLLAMQLGVRLATTDEVDRVRSHLHDAPRVLFDVAFAYSRRERHRLAEMLGLLPFATPVQDSRPRRG